MMGVWGAAGKFFSIDRERKIFLALFGITFTIIEIFNVQIHDVVELYVIGL